MDCAEVVGRLFADRLAFSISKLLDKSSNILKSDDLIMLRNSVFTVRNAEIWAVLSSNEVDLLKHKNRLFRQRNDQKCAVQS